MRCMIGFLVVLAILSPSGVGAAGGPQVRTGRIVAADLAGITLVLEDGETRMVEVLAGTEVFDEAGKRFPAVGLGPGDVVDEECESLPDGRVLARQIKLLRPFWQEMARHQD